MGPHQAGLAPAFGEHPEDLAVGGAVNNPLHSLVQTTNKVEETKWKKGAAHSAMRLAVSPVGSENQGALQVKEHEAEGHQQRVPVEIVVRVDSQRRVVDAGPVHEAPEAVGDRAAAAGGRRDIAEI